MHGAAATLISLSLNNYTELLQATTETKPHDDASSPSIARWTSPLTRSSAATAAFREKPMDTICATAPSSTAGGGGAGRADERRGVFAGGRRVFRHRAS